MGEEQLGSGVDLHIAEETRRVRVNCVLFFLSGS